jgi:CIC family chloride channel protein
LEPRESDTSIDVEPEVPLRPRFFHESVRDFLTELPRTEKRFWVLIIATGALSGLGAVVLVEMLKFIQDLAWPHAASLLAAVVMTDAPHRVLVLTLGGLLVAGVSLLLGRPLGGHGTAGVIEAIWLRGGR